MYKVSINCWDGLTGEFMGGKDFFESLDKSKSYYDDMVRDYNKDEVEIYLVDCKTNIILEQHITTEN